MGVDRYNVDLTKPLVPQVGHLGESYEEWVHLPIISKEGPRFYENKVMEFFTKTVWWAIPAIWLPIVCWNVTVSIRAGHSLSQVAVLVTTGLSIWTLIEYMMHRFLFHFKTNSYWSNTIHYVVHGFHHKHPMDHFRLVFPPAATAVLTVPFYILARALFTPSAAPAVFGGGLLGYVIYDCTHYYLHHGQPRQGYLRTLKRYHLNHHFQIQNNAYGVTSALWDYVFGTSPSAPKYAAKKN